MALLGTLTYVGSDYVFMETSFVKGSRQLILVSQDDNESNNTSAVKRKRGDTHYAAGGVLEERFIIGILDPVRKKQRGSIQVLNLVYQTINEIVRKAKLAGTYKFILGRDVYTHEGSTVEMQGSKYVGLDIRTEGLKLLAREVDKLNVKPRILNKTLEDMASNKTKYNTATFKDASLESLEREGFDMAWYKDKKYIPIHSVEDWDNIVIPAFVDALKKYREEPDFDYFIFSFDAESTGVNAYCEKHPNPDYAVYFSISFKDNEAFGVFLDMENFDNADKEGIAERITNMTRRDILEDREVILQNGSETFKYNRSEILVVGHNFMIDRRFGFTFGADVWFDLCTLQLSFNLDPFLTKGRNGLKHIVTKMLGIEYAELRDICGPKNMGMFRYLSDKRVIMMYGCADTDLHRLVTRKLISIAQESKEYYNGVDHAKKHIELDSIYMNHKADNDYQGHRVDFDGFKEEYEEKTRILNLYYSFMAQYAGRVKAYNDYELMALNAERYNVELEPISAKHIDQAPAIRVDKWSGKELLDVLFKTLNYPVLVWTQQNKKAKLEGRKFVPKPAVNTEALEHYLQYLSVADEQKIEESLNTQTSLEDLKIYSNYMRTDYIDPKTGKVLIEKKKFNGYRFPFMYLLKQISPILKSITAELKPVVEANSEYRFSVCNMTSAVTRRDLNSAQTVSKKAKFRYIPYDDDYIYGAVDQSAVEIRILYGLSKDKNLILPLNDPEKDSHTETAAMMHQRPAHTIDKDTRKGIKEVGFGIPYGKGIWSLAQSLFKDTSPDSIALAAQLYHLYEDKLAPVMKVLNGVRDKMEDPVNPPKSLHDYLEMDEEKEYGRMINEFGFCQHLEIRRGVEWYIQALRRKAGNFIIQGFAANLLRIIYVRMLKAFWAKGWIQNRMIRIHLTVHDEIDFSYHKSLNPVEVMSILHETLTVKISGFPTFYVGINFGNSWGEAKDDAAELPVNLVREMNKDFKEGKYNNYDFGNHLEFFSEKREDYFKRRVVKELLSVNENKNVWKLEDLNTNFTNYTVRALLSTVAKGKGAFPLPKSDNPMYVLGSYIPRIIAEHILPQDSRKHYLAYNGQHFQITPEFLDKEFETLEDMMEGKVKSVVELVEEEIEQLELEVDIDIEEDDDLDIDIDDEIGFDFQDDEDPDADEFAVDGIVDLSTGFLNRYVRLDGENKDEFKEYGSVEERVKAEIVESEKKIKKFDNFRVLNGRAIITVSSPELVTLIRKKCSGNTSSNPMAIHVFVKKGTSLTDMNSYDESFLTELDSSITNYLSGKAVQH